jgi:predicted DNA-binding transcriptional regulator AlpA
MIFMENLLSMADIARKYGVSRQAVLVLYQSGKLPEPAIMAGGRPAWRPEQISDNYPEPRPGGRPRTREIQPPRKRGRKPKNI